MTPTLRLIRSGAQKAARGWFPLVLATGIACEDSVGPEDEPAGPSGGIAFVSDRSGAVNATGAALCDIYRTNGDGTGLENLTKYPAQVHQDLRLSTVGMRIAFESDRVGCYNIWVMDTEGSGPVQPTGQSGERCNEMPRWSRDGSRIAFTSSREPIERSWEAYVMDVGGTDPHNVSDDEGRVGSSVRRETASLFPQSRRFR